ncbi:hypothetical protein HAX54_050111 [Datura stramonium]|uniref:Uncharacterized protein n=1 Tax=Datura stramonium TaxID=4076 RepID=A0ABS8SW83_DATST|nr:hypothetical protein [Datura stramonium]
MTEVVSAQSESLQSLDFNIRKVMIHDDTPIIYFVEASKSFEEDPFTFCSTVTISSGKVVHSEPRMVVEEEIYDDEKQCPNVDVAPGEMNDEASSEKVNKELKVEAPFPLLKHPVTTQAGTPNRDTEPKTTNDFKLTHDIYIAWLNNIN